jgi:ZIP family zinc transporter
MVQLVNEFTIVLLIASLAALLTYVGVPFAERYDVSVRVLSEALQFAAGVITALVAFSLMPPAVRGISFPLVVFSFFLGGILFVGMKYLTTRLVQSATTQEGKGSTGLIIGILVDLAIDGALIGIGSTLTLLTGLKLALGLAISTVPLVFLAIVTAKKQGMPRKNRNILALLFWVCIIGGAMLGYGVLRNQPLEVHLFLVSLASGFLITLVTQSMIPESYREGEPKSGGLLYMGGLSLYALISLAGN